MAQQPSIIKKSQWGKGLSHISPLYPQTEKWWLSSFHVPHRPSNPEPHQAPSTRLQTTYAEKKQAGAFKTSILWCEVRVKSNSSKSTGDTFLASNKTHTIPNKCLFPQKIKSKSNFQKSKATGRF